MIGSAFALTARRDPWFLPVLVGGELVALGLTSLMVLVWDPVFIVAGILLLVVTPLIVLNVRLKRVLMHDAEGAPPQGSADLP
jgi:hypothetical protein